jgi:predicted dehydrogenase
MRTPVSVGVVGLGSWGPRLAHVLDEIPAADVRWVCDLSLAAATKVAQSSRSARPAADVEVLLADESLDALVVATPPSTHYQLARRAIESGKHVFVEAPLALNGVQADELVRLAEATGRHLMVGHVLLFHPAVTALGAALGESRLGDVYYLWTQRLGPATDPRDDSVLWDLGTHDVSLILSLLGDEPVEVSAQGDAFAHPGVTDAAIATMTFATGIRAHLHLSRLDARRTRRLAVVGSKATAIFDDTEPEQKVTFYDRDPGADVVSPSAAGEEPLRRECEHFLAAIRSSTGAAPGAREAAAVVNVLEALQHSLDRGGVTEAVGASSLGPRVIQFPARTS